MIPLLKFHLLQITRSRLLVLWVLFAFFIEYSAAKLMFAMTVSANGVQTLIGMRELSIAMVYVQFGTAAMLASIYGIWIVPYLHEEQRAALTFALPVDKLVFPAVYALSFLILFLLQCAVFLLIMNLQFGPTAVFGPEFPWKEILSGTLLSVVALEVMVFGLSVASLYFGKIAAFLAGSAIVLVLQVSGVVFSAGWGATTLWKKVYAFLPPLGEIFFDFKGLAWEGPAAMHFGLWGIWAVIFVVLFRLRLNRA